MARQQKDCSLCGLPRESQDQVHYEYQDTRDWTRAAERASELGARVSMEETRSHFQYHRTVQPPPRGYLKRPKALAGAQGLPERLQDMLVVISRVRALSASQLAELLYWNGSEEQLASARNACYRDLRRLALDDFVYRVYPDTVSRQSQTKGRGRQDQLSLYFLGRDATPFIEEREEIPTSRRDYVVDAAALDEVKTMQQHETAEVVAALFRQAKSFEATGFQPSVPEFANTPPLTVSMSPLNWFGRERMTIDFRDPLAGTDHVIAPGGLAALGLSSPERQFSVLAPFFYEYDPGSRSVSAVAEDLLGYVRLARSGALAERLPDLPRRGYFPPVLVVCRDMARVIALQEELMLKTKKQHIDGESMPLALITDEVTLAHHGLAAQSWLSLWSTAADSRRIRLLEALLRSCRPLVHAVPSEVVLRYDAQGTAAGADE